VAVYLWRGRERTLHPRYAALASHYNFAPKFGAVTGRFKTSHTFADLDDLNGQGRAWLDQTANVRVHCTTGQRPVDLWPQEGLTPVHSVSEYRFLDPVRRTVSFEALVHYRGSRYSVPPAYAGQAVEVSAFGGQIIIRAADSLIAEHREAIRPGQCIVAREHLAELWKITAEQIQPPREQPMVLTAPPEVLRVDLRSFEEVLA